MKNDIHCQTTDSKAQDAEKIEKQIQENNIAKYTPFLAITKKNEAEIQEEAKPLLPKDQMPERRSTTLLGGKLQIDWPIKK
jgi:hypothetical protein